MAGTKGKTKDDAMRYRIAEILDPGVSVAVDLSRDELAEIVRGGDDSYRVADSGCEGEVELSARGTSVFVRGGFTVELEYTCRRCLAKGTRRFEIDLDWTFLPAEKYRSEVPEEEEVELTEGDLDVSFYEGDVIELRDVLREAILLEVDPYPACEPECAEVADAAASGGDDIADVDPRWLPLLNVKKTRRS